MVAEMSLYLLYEFLQKQEETKFYQMLKALSTTLDEHLSVKGP